LHADEDKHTHKPGSRRDRAGKGWGHHLDTDRCVGTWGRVSIGYHRAAWRGQGILTLGMVGALPSAAGMCSLLCSCILNY